MTLTSNVPSSATKREVNLSTEDPISRPPNYHSYLVRLWCEPSPPQWRASLRSIQSGEERRFAHVEQLFIFLYAQTVASSEEELFEEIREEML